MVYESIHLNYVYLYGRFCRYVNKMGLLVYEGGGMGVESERDRRIER